MRLTKVEIYNFRVFERVEFDLETDITVIVGPNAAGKTTVLEGIRLAKAVLAPRSPNETQQVLIALGIVSPHLPQILNVGAIARDTNKNVAINTNYSLSEQEISLARNGIPRLALVILQSQMGQAFANAASFAPFLSSPQGIRMLADVTRQLTDGIEAISATKQCLLHLTIDVKSGAMTGVDPISHAVYQHLESIQPNVQSLFSYFPADRAMPVGEVPVQIGAADVAIQMETHNSQPQLKYQRLKNTVFNALIENEQGRNFINKEFELIFNYILKGRRLDFVGTGPNGMLSIIVIDTQSGRRFNIDNMSSGEKGILLLFLTISRTIAAGGLVLLDEPELHLNPKVCRSVLDFIVQHYATTRSIQFVICSHSPEILTSAFNSPQCSLKQIISETLITKIRLQDTEVVYEALRQLGTSEGETLIHRGTLFVEGPHDIELLEAGFSDISKSFKLVDLGGRREVEKHIRALQSTDGSKAHERASSRYFFLFDHDDEPTSLKSTNNVRLRQLQRRCLENYLLDTDILADFAMDRNFVANPMANHGQVSQEIQQFATSQLLEAVTKQVFRSYGFSTLEMKNSEFIGGFELAGSKLNALLEKMRDKLSDHRGDEWLIDFQAKCSATMSEQEKIWATKWIELCDGKKVMQQFFQKVQPIKRNPLQFKKAIMEKMRSTKTDSWQALDGLLRSLTSDEGEC